MMMSRVFALMLVVLAVGLTATSSFAQSSGSTVITVTPPAPQPVVVQPPAALPPANTTAIVRQVDVPNTRVVLSDGSVVYLRPDTPVFFNGRALSVSDLRPGDQIVIAAPPAAPVVVTPSAVAVSALPREFVIVEGQSIQVLQRPQTP
jgi:ferric-dicitrate binding protein FerR (iron transport regulator)